MVVEALLRAMSRNAKSISDVYVLSGGFSPQTQKVKDFFIKIAILSEALA